MTNEEIVEALKHLIGTPYDESLKATVTQLTGRDVVFGPSDIYTMIYDPSRVHIRADAEGVITGFSFN